MPGRLLVDASEGVPSEKEESELCLPHSLTAAMFAAFQHSQVDLSAATDQWRSLFSGASLGFASLAEAHTQTSLPPARKPMLK